MKSAIRGGSKGEPGRDIGRRGLLKTSAIWGSMGIFGSRIASSFAADTIALPFANGARSVVTYPQKRPMILLTSRPVQLETPFSVFNESAITPNDAFFVRWHLSVVPTEIDASTFTVSVHGRVKTPLTLTLDNLQRDFEAVELTAVCQCSGNSRGFFEPRVPGGEWGNGAMGNAVWKGVRLGDILDKAGLESDAAQVRFNGLDEAPVPETPDFIKALDIDFARDHDVIVAYAMNGEALPLLNGFPVRLVVPGYYATYWVKMLSDIEVINEVDQNFWMSKAYRIPADPCGCMEPGQKDIKMIPINRLTVRSFVTSLADGATVPAGSEVVVKGIAFDSGYGIKRVLFSSDGGKTWGDAQLGANLGNYSFRTWEAGFTPQKGASYILQCMAVNGIGESQRLTARWNPGGYLRNIIESVNVRAV